MHIAILTVSADAVIVGSGVRTRELADDPAPMSALHRCLFARTVTQAQQRCGACR